MPNFGAAYLKLNLMKGKHKQEILRYVSHSAWFVTTARLPDSILKPQMSQLDSRPMHAVCRAKLRATVARTRN